MAKRGIIKRTFSNVKGYTYKLVGMQNIKATTAYIGSILQNVLTSTKEKPQEENNFTEVIRKNGITEEMLAKKMRQLLINSIIFTIVGLLIVFYAGFNAGEFKFYILLNYFLAALVMFAFASRMHFYRFLISKKRLDLTLKDWCRAILKGEI